MELKTLDLNLLRVLLVLIQERNTYRAAERLHTSQPAVSRSLAKLRKEFDDPLFVRDKQGLKLTAKAEELASKLPKIFDDLQKMIDGDEFDHRRLSGKLRISLNAYLMVLHGSDLYNAFRKYCPNLQLELFSFDKGTINKILDDSIEIALTFDDLKVNKEVYQTEVGQLDFTMVCQKGLFADNIDMSFESCLEYPIAGLIMPELNLERIRVKRALNKPINLAFRCQQITPILDVILNAPIMFPAPQKLFARLDKKEYQEVKVSDYQLTERVALIFNNKYYQSAKYLWLEKVIKSILEQ